MKIAILDSDYETGAKNTSSMIAKGVLESKIKIFRVCENRFPDMLNYDAFIISGSAACFDDKKAWIKSLIKLIKQLHKNKKPLLGICFGHQIIAHALGGKVIHGKEREFGYRKIRMTKCGKDSGLFSRIKNKFTCFEAHRDYVTKLPSHAILLAKNDCGIQAFNIGNSYGIQFHPEITPRLAVQVAKDKNLDVKKTRKDSKHYGRPVFRILNNFEKIVKEQNK